MKRYKDTPYFVTEDGKVIGIKGCEMKLNAGKSGYFQVRSTRLNKTFSVHRMVAETYIPNIKNKSDVNHINGIKTDNRVENLEWNTSSENRQHAFDTGLKKYTERQRTINSELFSKPVLDTQTGIFYNSAKEASKLLGINKNTLYGYLLGHNPNKTSLIYA